MKRIASVLGIVAVAGLLFVGLAGAGDKKSHEVTVTVVSTDLTANTITFKDDKGTQKTVPVLGAAVDSMKIVKAGDSVILTCQDTDKGDHEGITGIKPAKK